LKTLERTIGPVALVAIAISAMLGSGIFVLPGLAAAITGPSVWLAYLVAGLCVLPAALSKSELATAMPAAGGTYVYIERTLGPFAGTVAGLGVWLSLLLKSAFALVGFSAYMSALAKLPVVPSALVLLTIIVGLNLVGVQKVVKVQTLIVAVALAGLALLGTAGAFQIDDANLRDPFRHGTFGFIEGVGFVIIAYNGVTKIASIAEEVVNPGRNIPLGMLASLTIVGAVYSGVTFILVANIPVEQLATDYRPIYSLAAAVGGPTVATIAAVLGVVTMTSMANAGLLAASRYPFAMSREQLLPRAFGQINPRFKTPTASILFTGVLMGVAIIALDVAALAKTASAIVMLLFTLVNVAVIVLRETRVQWYRPSFSSPLYPWMQIVGILAGVGVLALLGPLVPIALVGVCVPGTLLFLLYGRKQTSRKGVAGTLGKRVDLSPRRQLEAVDDSDGLAAVVVPILGDERSPERLVEMGAALAAERPIDVVHITDVPAQAPLDDSLKNEASIRSLRRRLDALAEDERITVQFEAVVSHDVPDTVNNATIESQCDWLVMEWHGEAAEGFGALNPLGWFADNLSCNLALFKDAGIRRIREIVVMPDPGPDDALVASTGDHLADILDANVTFARFVADDATDEYVKSQAGYLDEMRSLCAAETSVLVVRGTEETAAMAEISASYDLLIFGGATERSFFKQLFGTRRDRLTEKAACSVLRLRTSKAVMHPSLAAHTRDQDDGANGLIAKCAIAKISVSKLEALFAAVSEAIAPHIDGVSAAEISAGLLAREKSQSTSVGQGVAMPHASVDGAKTTVLGVFTTSAPIETPTLDGQAVDLFFVMVGPPDDRQSHLEILGQVSRTVMDKAVVERLRGAEDGAAIIRTLRPRRRPSRRHSGS